MPSLPLLPSRLLVRLPAPSRRVEMGLSWSHEPKTQHTSFYELHAKAIDGTAFDFADLKGDVIMITNVASA